MVKYNNVFVVNGIQQLGGVETYLWEIAKKYHAYDIVIAYREADAKQLDRLKKLVKCIRLNKPIECKRCFQAYEFDYDMVKADEYIQVIHANYEIQELPPNISPNITKYVAVSKWVADAYKRLLEQRDIHKDVEVCHNPITIEEPKKLLKLISPTRLSKEKGKDRMIKLADKLIEKDIPFIWLVFTDGDIPTLPGFIKMPVSMDIRSYIKDADYLVQLSDTEAWSYSILESWCLGTMTITTPIPSVYEQGLVDGLNGYVIDYDMSDLDNFIDKIYKGVHKFSYTPPKDRYDELLIKEPSKYDLNDYVDVKATRNFYDTERDVWVMDNRVFTIEKKDLPLYQSKWGVVVNDT